MKPDARIAAQILMIVAAITLHRYEGWSQPLAYTRLIVDPSALSGLTFALKAKVDAIFLSITSALYV